MNTNIYINGYTLTTKICGVQRFAYNILRKLDELNLNQNIIIVVPHIPTNTSYTFNNIQFKVHKSRFNFINNNEILWTNLILARIIKNNYLVNLSNFAPLFKKNQLVVIHDIIPFRYPKTCSLLWGSFFRFMIRLFVKRVQTLCSISQFSANEILQVTNSNRLINVLGNSGEHILDITPNDDILQKLNLNPQKYVLTLSSQTHIFHKNFNILYNIANKIDLPIISVGVGYNQSNIQFTGIISDEALKSLYNNAYAFIFPSLYEGFGIPLLEAMSCGTPVICSDIPVFHEICENAALYFDVNDENEIVTHINQLHNINTREKLINNGYSRLKYYTWDTITAMLLTHILIVFET